jgi:hypothetical protein
VITFHFYISYRLIWNLQTRFVWKPRRAFCLDSFHRITFFRLRRIVLVHTSVFAPSFDLTLVTLHILALSSFVHSQKWPSSFIWLSNFEHEESLQVSLQKCILLTDMSATEN